MTAPNGGGLSYTMPTSWNSDNLYWSSQYRLFAKTTSRTGTGGTYAGETLNRGIGQVFYPGGDPMWVHTSQVRPAAMALLLVERAWNEAGQCTNWRLGYQVNSPRDQMFDTQSTVGFYHGLPLLHSDPKDLQSSNTTINTAVAGKGVKFNYMFCDYHVELMNPRDTISKTTTSLQVLSSTAWQGGDYMWTIRPDIYRALP